MAENGPLTPEKQLLRLIEGKGGAPVPPGAAPGRASGRFSLDALRGAFLGRFSFFRRSATKKIAATRKRPFFTLVTVNRFLTAAVAAGFVYVAGDALASMISLQRTPNFQAKKEPAGATDAPNVSPLNESSYYLQKVASRDIFKQGGRPEAPKESAEREAVSVENNPATSGLSLVGISWSANPDVIIEDKDRKRTYFVKRGQVVGDGVKVEAVFKDHVVLSYEGQEFELR